MRKRSPSKSPPVTGLCGSQAKTATLFPCPRTWAMSCPINVLLPTPGLPVTATTRPGFAGGRTAPMASPRAARVSSRDNACRSRRRKPSHSASSMARLAASLQEFDDFIERRARAKDLGDTHRAQLGHICFGNDAPHPDADAVELRLAQHFPQARHERHIAAR